MTVRRDVSVDWFASPRVITVNSPSVEILVQDLVDTLRELEDELENIGFVAIVRATGKQELTTELSVGITCTLLNARLAFEARPSAPFVRCDVVGGNLLAVDEAETPIEVIEITSFTQIVYDLSPAPTQLRIRESTARGILQG